MCIITTAPTEKLGATMPPRPAAAPEAAAALAAAAEAAWFAGRRRPGCDRRGHLLGVDRLLDRLALRFQLVEGRLAAQVEPALLVDLGGLDQDDVVQIGDVL